MTTNAERIREERLAYLDTPEYDAKAEKEAETRAREIEADDLGFRMFTLRLSHQDIDKALWSVTRPDEALNLSDTRPANQLRVADASQSAATQARRAIHALVVRECKVDIRARDMRQIECDPDLLEDHRIRQAYNAQVSAIAWAKGDGEARFVRKFNALIEERRDAEEYGDDAGVRSAERQLDRHTGVPYPLLPAAAWDAADLLPASDRQQELDRLEKKYGPRHPASNGAAKTSRRRLTTRPMPALSTH